MGLLFGTSVLWVVLGLHAWLTGAPLTQAWWDGLVWGSVAARLHAVTFVLLLNPSVNALCHWPHKWLGGYQNSRAAHAFRTSNNWIVAFLTAGEGFHNNHHDQQATAQVRLDALGVGGRLGLLGRDRPARAARSRHPRAPAEGERAVSRATHWPDAQAAEMFAESESVAISSRVLGPRPHREGEGGGGGRRRGGGGGG